MNIGKAIEKIRTQKGMPRSKLVKLAGLSQPTIFNIEHGNNDNFGMKALQQISDALDVPLLLLMYMAQEESDIEELGQDSINNLRRDLKKSLMKPQPLTIEI